MARKRRPFVAYEIHKSADMPIVTAPIERAWMDATRQRYAYRCLPLVVANQAGWFILNPVRFTARWNGGREIGDLRLHFGRRPRDTRINSHFGSGIITFSLPYLFRTPTGVNLWAKGPSNWIKDAVQPLEGIIEADWSSSTFTMNWKITRPNHTVRFEQGEPICMIVPVPRGLAEKLNPERTPITQNEKLNRQYHRWEANRNEFLHGLEVGVPETVRRGWQREYFLGVRSDGKRFARHQTRLNLAEFQTALEESGGDLPP